MSRLRDRLGLFGRNEWLGLLAAAGSAPRPVTDVTKEGRPPRMLFVRHQPRP